MLVCADDPGAVVAGNGPPRAARRQESRRRINAAAPPEQNEVRACISMSVGNKGALDGPDGYDIEAATGVKSRKVAEETPSIRWSFVHGIYAIFAAQLTVFTGVTTMFFKMHLRYRKTPSINGLLLAMFTLSVSLMICLCASYKGNLEFLCGVLMTTAAIRLVIYTFWAQLKSYPTKFLVPVAVSSTVEVVVFDIIQVIFLKLGR